MAIRSLSQGRESFFMEPLKYGPAPSALRQSSSGFEQLRYELAVELFPFDRNLLAIAISQAAKRSH